MRKLRCNDCLQVFIDARVEVVYEILFESLDGLANDADLGLEGVTRLDKKGVVVGQSLPERLP